ncbi:hypothetical protein T03_8727, partial [Trichinella britovi]
VENYDDTLIVDYINATTVTAETGIKACPPVPACFHKDYQWNRIPRVEHGGHQFHHGIGLYPPVGVLESHGQSLRFCACRLVADMKDTNVAEAKTFSPTTLLVHPGRSGCRLSQTNPCAEWEQAVNAPRWSRSDGHVKPGRTNVAPGFALRLRPRANKNLHIPSGYASGPQALPSGYAPGQIKICIFPQAMPQAFYCTGLQSQTNRCADWEQAVNAPHWLMLTLVTTRTYERCR